jgi:hypothetical protein
MGRHRVSKAVTEETQKQLAWEAHYRPRAAVVALLAVVGLVATIILQQNLASGSPQPSGLETLLRVERDDVNRLESLQIPVYEYLKDNRTLQLLIGAAGFIGYAAMGWTVAFLGLAARARRRTRRIFALHLPLAGGLLLGVHVLLTEIVRVVIVDDVLSGPRTVEAVANTDTWLVGLSQVVRIVGTLALGTGLVAVGMNAIRTGLLTRLFGFLGVVSGGLMLLQVLFELVFRLGGRVIVSDPMPIVGIFWLAGVAAIFIGRWPGGVPRAWHTGEAEPWPAAGRAAPAPAAQAAPQRTTPARRRKRKKRKH